jgi:hypothetical protein
MTKTILIILPRGETLRNFLYSGIISRFRENYHIVLIAVKPNESIWNLLKENSHELIELKSKPFSYLFGLFFELYDLAHNRFMWSEAAKVRWEMRDVEATSFASKIVRILKKSLARLLANQGAMEWLEKIDLYLAAKEHCVIEWEQKLKPLQIDLVFNTSHSHARNALPVVYAASKLNIKTLTFLFSWDNLTSQGRVIPKYDYYLAWNKSIKRDFERLYPHIQTNQIFVSGTPQFMGHFQTEKHLSKEELFKKLGLKSNEKYFLYSSGMSHHLPEEPYVVERIADMMGELGEDYRLVVRTYAKDKHDVFASLKIRRPDIIIPEVNWEKNYQTPLPEDQAFFSSLLKFCIAGINVASTVSLELCMLDKPAINVAYNPPDKNIYPYNYTRFYNFDHYRPIVDSGAVELAHSEDELRWLLKAAITNPELKSRERMKLLNSFFNVSPSEITSSTFSNSIMSIMNAELG